MFTHTNSHWARYSVIDADSMPTDKYLEYFFPFGQPDMIKSQNGVTLNISGDVSMMALTLTMSDRPVAFGAEFQKEYVERIDWIIRIMRDLSYSQRRFCTTTTLKSCQTVKRIFTERA